IDGIVDLNVGFNVEEPHLEIEVDLAMAEIYGLTPGDVRRAASTFIAGILVGSLFENQRVFDVVVWGTPDTRQSLSDIRGLLINTPIGGITRLEDVADVRITANPSVIKRDLNSRYIDIGANVRGRDLGSVVNDVERRIREIEFPLEYHTELMGEYTELQAAQKSMLIYFVASLIGIFLLLQSSFGSWRLAFFFFLSLPVSLLGGALAALAGGNLVSLGSLLGFLAVFAIAARTGLTSITHYRQLERREGEPISASLVRRGTAERFAPVVMTAVVAALAFLPFALLGNIAGHEILHPMAGVVLGGLVTTTLVNLLVIPSLYLRFGADAEPEIIIEEKPSELIA
ncbi:MAG: efflux RND transporter permease subunit, partial [Gemmatimonadetes bacterium]|nr:efflux RND transporter permease subunit [Gemmatimonadota bacterium]